MTRSWPVQGEATSCITQIEHTQPNVNDHQPVSRRMDLGHRAQRRGGHGGGEVILGAKHLNGREASRITHLTQAQPKVNDHQPVSCRT